MENGRPKGLLLDHEVVFFFDKERFCRELAAGDEKLAGGIYSIIFESGLYECCNSGYTVFDQLYDQAVYSFPKRKLTNEELYDKFVRTWNACFMLDAEIADQIFLRSKMPIVLLAVTNPLHCEKVRASRVMDYCRAAYVHHHCRNIGGEMKRLGEEVKIPHRELLYVGTAPSHKAAAEKLGMKTISHREQDILFAHLSLEGVV
ncbi:hypothetical protein HY250_04335 [Candidatus Azambacteria bacterium]|nr:hypothetical protein [Candidatus Azambacteria bacterium]MBI3685606.1 hypothetical protein [Candidatus Azambacteria bacterium]